MSQLEGLLHSKRTLFCKFLGIDLVVFASLLFSSRIEKKRLMGIPAMIEKSAR